MRGNRQKDAEYYIRLHRRMIKPPYPVLLYCPNCGHGLIEVNADIIEIANSFGLPPNELKGEDAWTRLRHSCGTSLVIYFV